MVQVTRKDEREANENIIRRFNRKVLQSGVLAEAKASMRFAKPLSKPERRVKAIIRKERKADKLNKAAEKIKQAGMQTGFHNHEFEFATLEGRLIYDALMERFDPGLVKMQFQTEVINLGYKAADYFKKYPGRFVSSHLSDWTAGKKEVPVGEGIIDWKEFFAAAKTGGVKNIFVEMSLPNLKGSASNIRKMKG